MNEETTVLDTSITDEPTLQAALEMMAAHVEEIDRDDDDDVSDDDAAEDDDSGEVATVTPAATAGGAAVVKAKAQGDGERRYVAITLTDELRDALTKKVGDKSWGLWARAIIAKELGVTIAVDRAAPKKYASEAEKKKAQAAQRKSKAELVKQLLAEHAAKMAAAEKAAASAE